MTLCFKLFCFLHFSRCLNTIEIINSFSSTKKPAWFSHIEFISPCLWSCLFDFFLCTLINKSNASQWCFLHFHRKPLKIYLNSFLLQTNRWGGTTCEVNCLTLLDQFLLFLDWLSLLVDWVCLVEWFISFWMDFCTV